MLIAVLVFVEPQQRLNTTVGQYCNNLCRLRIRHRLRKQAVQRHFLRKCEIATHGHRILWKFKNRRFPKFGFFGKRVGIVSSRRVAVHPIGNQLEFRLRHALVISKIAETLDCSPRRHRAREHGLLDRNRARLDVGVLHQ